MRSKLLGSILLIIGTSIGAGMLGLPIAAAQLGFIGSVILLIVCWFVMTASAFLILEVNLWLPQNNNLVSMAKKTMGPLGQMLAWIAYLLLLYSLLCAYIAGGSDLFQHALLNAHIAIPLWASAILFTFLFGSAVFLGIRSVDKVNRVLMFIKLSAFFILIFFITPFISASKLTLGDFHYLSSTSALLVTTTAFGWAILIPSLRTYFADDLKKLKKAIILGSLIPLICYIIWDAAIMGVIPIHGELGLTAILHSGNSTSGLVNTLSSTVGNSSTTFCMRLFTSICVLTSFLGVALCLTDFFADGLRLEKKGINKILIHALTFIPSLCIAIFFPNAFIKALGFAGIYCSVLLILLPACMAWAGRYHRCMAIGFTVRGGKSLLLLLMLFSLLVITKALSG